MATKPRTGGGVLFYRDENGRKRDAELHAEILGEDALVREADRNRAWLPEKPVTPPKVDKP